MLIRPSGNGNLESSKTQNNMATPSRRGAFVVLEGIDRSGKTSQCKLLLQRLLQAGLAASSARFPNRTTATGRIINEYLSTSSSDENVLDDRAIHLLFSANRWEAARDLSQQLASGTTVICDRYAYSGVAFSSAKVAPKKKKKDDKENNNENDGENSNKEVNNGQDKSDKQQPDYLLSLDWCQAPDRGLPAPDCVIFLQLTPDQAEQRGGYGEERYETREMQLRVRERFAELQALDENSSKQHGAPTWHVIDAAQSMEQVEEEIFSTVQAVLERLSEQDLPLQKLWEQGEYPMAQN